MVEPYHVWPWLPEGTSGDCEIRHCRLFSGDDFETELWIDGSRWMSDGEQEMQEHKQFVKDARGDILSTGLGVGFLVNLLLIGYRYNSITVIEKNKDVVELVWKHLVDKAGMSREKLHVVIGDADRYVLTRDYTIAFVDHYQPYPGKKEKETIRHLWGNRVQDIRFWSQVAE